MLEKRRLGSTDMNVSLLGFGGIPIMRVTPGEAAEAVGEALRSGIDFIDTARGYGDSESKIGQALRGYQGDVVVASKSPRRDREGMLEDFGKSLHDLGLESIDLYQLHCVNRADDYDKAISEAGACEALEHLRSQGRLRYIGITSHNLEILKRAVVSGRFDTVQVLYNFVEPDASEQVVPMAADRHVGIIAMKPLAGGCIEQYDLALRYVLRTPGLVAIPGMATVEEVRRNVEVAGNLRELTKSEMAKISEIRQELGGSYCRRCDYCQPCPNEIPISFALHISSIRKRVGDTIMKSDHYRDLLDKLRRCDQCGQCEERCPFGLPVRELIEASRGTLVELLG
jgi:predicted aldo/keto reductase-like oxidoreductase